LQARDLTRKRYPNGVDGQFFYEKRCPSHRPSWMTTAPIWSGRKGGNIDYCVVSELPALVWVANLASLELHTSLSRADHPERPTMCVFDLDPGLRPRSSSAAGSGCGCGTCSTAWASRPGPRPRV